MNVKDVEDVLEKLLVKDDDKLRERVVTKVRAAAKKD